jgi:hypothetical protein
MNEKRTPPLRKPTVEQYERADMELRLYYAPYTYACMKCGWPVRDGYCCATCGDNNPREPKAEA